MYSLVALKVCILLLKWLECLCGSEIKVELQNQTLFNYGTFNIKLFSKKQQTCTSNLLMDKGSGDPVVLCQGLSISQCRHLVYSLVQIESFHNNFLKRKFKQ